MHLVKRFEHLLKVLPVLFAVGRVDHQQILILVKSVKIGIIHSTALFIGNHGVLTLFDFQAGGIIGKHVLQKIKGPRAGNDKTAHMRNVEKTRMVACCQMFLQNSALVLNRHIPAAKINHGRIQRQMAIVKNGSL